MRRPRRSQRSAVRSVDQAVLRNGKILTELGVRPGSPHVDLLIRRSDIFGQDDGRTGRVYNTFFNLIASFRVLRPPPSDTLQTNQSILIHQHAMFKATQATVLVVSVLASFAAGAPAPTFSGGPGPVKLPPSTTTTTTSTFHFGPGPVKLPPSATTTTTFTLHLGPGPVKPPTISPTTTTLHWGPGPVKPPPASETFTLLPRGPGPVVLPTTTSTSALKTFTPLPWGPGPVVLPTTTSTASASGSTIFCEIVESSPFITVGTRAVGDSAVVPN